MRLRLSRASIHRTPDANATHSRAEVSAGDGQVAGTAFFDRRFAGGAARRVGTCCRSCPMAGASQEGGKDGQGKYKNAEPIVLAPQNVPVGLIVMPLPTFSRSSAVP
jgi:hypothetical protein